MRDAQDRNTDVLRKQKPYTDQHPQAFQRARTKGADEVLPPGSSSQDEQGRLKL